MKYLFIIVFLVSISVYTASAQSSPGVEEPQYFSLSLNGLGGEAVGLGAELQLAMHLKRGTSFYLGGGFGDASLSFDQFYKFGAMQRIIRRKVITVDTGLGLFFPDVGNTSLQFPIDVSFIVSDRLSINTGVRFGYTHLLLGLKYEFERTFEY